MRKLDWQNEKEKQLTQKKKRVGGHHFVFILFLFFVIYIFFMVHLEKCAQLHRPRVCQTGYGTDCTMWDWILQYCVICRTWKASKYHATYILHPWLEMSSLLLGAIQCYCFMCQLQNLKSTFLFTTRSLRCYSFLSSVTFTACVIRECDVNISFWNLLFQIWCQ